MRKYILHKDNFIKEELTTHLVVDIENYISDIQSLIDSFNLFSLIYPPLDERGILVYV